MRIQKDIDPEAVKLLEEAEWRWDQSAYAFRRTRRAHGETTEAYKARQRLQPCPDVISYEELDQHGLAPHKQDVVTAHEKANGLRWLRERIKKAEPTPS